MINNLKERFLELSIAKKILIIGGILLILIILVGTFISSNLFKSDAVKIAYAFTNTFKTQPQFIEDLKVNEIQKWVDDKNYTVNLSTESEDSSVNYSFGVNPSEIQFSGKVSNEYMPETDFVIAYTNTDIKAQIPGVSDVFFVYDYTQIPDGYLIENIEEETFEKINQVLSMYWDEKNEKMEKEITDAIINVITEMEITYLESKEYVVDNKERKCEGYGLTFTNKELTEIIKEIEYILIEEVDETTYKTYEEMLQEIKTNIKDFPDIKLEIYIYKNKLASVHMIIEENNQEFELLFKGGKFRTQNIEFITTNEFSTNSLKIEGKKDGSKESYTFYYSDYYSYDDEEMFVFKYDGDNGNFYIEIEDSILRGHLLTERDNVTLSLDVEDIEMKCIIKRGTDLQKIQGTEFNIGKASEDDFTNLLEESEELYDSIFNIVYMDKLDRIYDY